jgi:dissimilatory sulfite reductase (desulfoviridin) alpha/beta subunit
MVLAEPGGTSFLDVLRGRTDHILDACTRCGKCLEACPMIEPAGLDPADAVDIIGGTLDLLAGGEGTKGRALGAGVHEQRQVHSGL